MQQPRPQKTGSLFFPQTKARKREGRVWPKFVARKTSTFLPLTITILKSERKRQNESGQNRRKMTKRWTKVGEGRLELDSSEEKEKD
jgi:hypothetical protein